MLLNIPAELRALPQWVAVDMAIDPESGKPLKEPLNPRFTHYPAKTSDPSTWGTFEQAVATGRPIGFVFSKDDPYAVIDLDNKAYAPATPAQLELHNKILEGIESYIERSISKRGYHVIIRGSIPTGVNYGNVELYSWGRMMIFTGDVVKQMPIDDYNEAINNMYLQMKEQQDKNRPTADLEQVDGHMEDGDIFTMGSEAANGDKFNKLCNGDWEHFGFPSQSEADLALLSMFAFYSKDNEQCRRLFRMTVLGKREKYQINNNHLDRILLMVRSKEPQPINVEEANVKVAAVMAEIAAASAPVIPAAPTVVIPSAPDAITIPKLPKAPIPKAIDNLNLPGVLGMMADFIYTVSPRQVHEYSVCAALAMLSGITGRAYNISRTGLNQYIIALGNTGTGKEGMARGISSLEAAMNKGLTDPSPIIIGKPASAQGLHKSLIANPCGLSILGEVGNEFRIMLSPKIDPNSLAIKTAYLDLYNKSGESNVYHAINYSKAENNMTAINSPNLTILGETVPGTFYASINEQSASDGFLARLMVIEYKGIRHDYNDNNTQPSDELIKRLSSIRDHAVDLQARGIVEHIPMTPEAKVLLNQYDKDITARMNVMTESGVVGVSDILNRSHVKALKLAGLSAVAINHFQPVVTLELARWAIDFVNASDLHMTTKFKAGEIGEANDLQMEPVIRRAITQYFKMDVAARLAHKQPQALIETNYISFSYLRQYCRQREPFKSHKLGPATSIEIAIKDLVAAGVLLPVPRSQLPAAKNGANMNAYALGEQF